MTEPHRHDWPRIIAEIEASGVSLWKLALMAHVHMHTMQSWAAGKTEPRHSVGEWLLEFHVELVQKM